jgi:hypothetical protein
VCDRTTWLPESSRKSPDRLDALVIAALAVISPDSRAIAPTRFRISSTAAQRSSFAARVLSRANPNAASARYADGTPFPFNTPLPAHMRAGIGHAHEIISVQPTHPDDNDKDKDKE